MEPFFGRLVVPRALRATSQPTLQTAFRRWWCIPTHWRTNSLGLRIPQSLLVQASQLIE